MICLYLSTDTWAPDSALIRWHTCCEYSHVGFCIPQIGKDGAPADWYLSSHLDGGVLCRTESGIGKFHEAPKKRLFVTAPGVEDAYGWAQTQIGKKYDYSAIFGLAMDRNWRAEDSWYCSELVAAAFEHIGKPLFNPLVKVWRITPRDILLSLVVSGMDRMTAVRR